VRGGGWAFPQGFNMCHSNATPHPIWALNCNATAGLYSALPGSVKQPRVR
jgi:hypothetical protein